MPFPLSPSEAAAEAVCTRFLVMRSARAIDAHTAHFINQIAGELNMKVHIMMSGELNGQPAQSQINGNSSPDLIFRALSQKGCYATIMAEESTAGSVEALRQEFIQLGYFHKP